MDFSLSINTDPFVYRYAEPEDLARVVTGEIGVRCIQLTHEYINPAGSQFAILTYRDRDDPVRRKARLAGAAFALPLRPMVDTDYNDVSSPDRPTPNRTPGREPSLRNRRSSTSSKAR